MSDIIRSAARTADALRVVAGDSRELAREFITTAGTRSALLLSDELRYKVQEASTALLALHALAVKHKLEGNDQSPWPAAPTDRILGPRGPVSPFALAQMLRAGVHGVLNLDAYADGLAVWARLATDIVSGTAGGS